MCCLEHSNLPFSFVHAVFVGECRGILQSAAKTALLFMHILRTSDSTLKTLVEALLRVNLELDKGVRAIPQLPSNFVLAKLPQMHLEWGCIFG